MTNFKLDITLKQDMSNKEASDLARDMAERMFAAFPEHDILVVGHNRGETEFAILNPLYFRTPQAQIEESGCLFP